MPTRNHRGRLTRVPHHRAQARSHDRPSVRWPEPATNYRPAALDPIPGLGWRRRSLGHAALCPALPAREPGTGRDLAATAGQSNRYLFSPRALAAIITRTWQLMGNRKMALLVYSALCPQAATTESK